MKPEEYKPYILQRELYICVTQGMHPEQVQQDRYTITVEGRKYPVEPLAGTTARHFRKRFYQLDRAVKGMLGRTGNNDPIEVGVHFPTGEYETIQIYPTPDQEQAEYRRMLKELDRKHPDRRSWGLSDPMAQLLVADNMPRPQAAQEPQAAPQAQLMESRTSRPPAPGNDSRTSRPPKTPKMGR